MWLAIFAVGVILKISHVQHTQIWLGGDILVWISVIIKFNAFRMCYFDSAFEDLGNYVVVYLSSN